MQTTYNYSQPFKTHFRRCPNTPSSNISTIPQSSNLTYSKTQNIQSYIDNR